MSQAILLPTSADVAPDVLSRVFNDTTTSYKHLFLNAILEELRESSFSVRQLSLRSLVAGMVAKAWYPIQMFRLSLGHQDRISEFARNLRGISESPIPRQRLRREILKALTDYRSLVRYVPYRLLSPFFESELHGTSDHARNRLIQHLAEAHFDSIKPLYKFVDDDVIELHSAWIEYIARNLAIVSGWAEFNWVSFLESRNPGIPGVSRKAGMPAQRSPLTRQTAFWSAVISETREGLRCVYSGEWLSATNLHLDHVLPWTFVCHDSLWNLVPVVPEANISKGNRLPDPGYLPAISSLHFHALSQARTFMPAARWERAASSYLGDLRVTWEELSDSGKFCSAYERAVRPQLDVARSVGFSPNWLWRPT